MRRRLILLLLTCTFGSVYAQEKDPLTVAYHTTIPRLKEKGYTCKTVSAYLADSREEVRRNLGSNKHLYYIAITDANKKMGLTDYEGNIIIPCQYRYVNPSTLLYKEGIRVGNFNNECGVMTFEGKVMVPCIYKSAYSDRERYVKVVNQQDQVGAYNYDGTVLLPCEYERFELTADDIFLVMKNGKWGYYAQGREIIPCIYDDAKPFTNDVAMVKQDGEVKMLKNPLKDASQIKTEETVLASNKKKEKGPAVSRYPAPDSDVDKNIPVATQKAETTFAFIICNENYADAPVPYALNDGRMFREYCQKTLGLPEKNINLYEDATFGNIIQAVDKMKSVADAYEGDANIIFYYAGHGFPDEKQSTAYLLPVDGNASDITTTGYSLAKLYQELSQMKLKSSVVFLDACFSGAKREDQMLASGRGVAIKVKEEAPRGNMVMFSAAQGDETAHQLEEKHHGLFTYYLLKELQATKGEVDLGTLTDYVTKQVKRQSVVINNKKQTPTVIPSQSLANRWQQMRLR